MSGDKDPKLPAGFGPRPLAEKRGVPSGRARVSRLSEILATKGPVPIGRCRVARYRPEPLRIAAGDASATAVMMITLCEGELRACSSM
jgi:hypothetical protein